MLGLFSKFNGDFTLFKEIRTSCLALCRSVFAIINGKIQLCLTRTPPKSPAVSIKDSRGQTDLAHTWPEVLPVCFSAGTNFSVAIWWDFCAAPARQLCAREQMHRKLRGPSTNLHAAFQLRCTRFKWVKVHNSILMRSRTPHGAKHWILQIFIASKAVAWFVCFKRKKVNTMHITLLLKLIHSVTEQTDNNSEKSYAYVNGGTNYKHK